jgi:hypothetical protein
MAIHDDRAEHQISGDDPENDKHAILLVPGRVSKKKRE